MVRSSSDGKHGWIEIARSLRGLLDRSGPLEVIDLMLDGLTTTMIDGHVAGAPILKDALSAYLAEDLEVDVVLRWWQLGFNAAALLWDDVAWSNVIERAVRVARERGSLRLLAFGLNYLAIAHIGAGELELAAAAVEEGEDILASIGQPTLLSAGPFVEAARGFGDPRVAEGVYGRVTQYTSTMVLANGQADYRAGLQAAHDAFDHDVIGKTMVWQEIVEIASGCGDYELANAALGVVRSQVEACSTDFGMGTLARCEALLSSGRAAEDRYLESIALLDHPQARMQFARAHLVFGEWLQRGGRENDARHHLQIAHDLLDNMGARAFAARAERALKATGWKARTSSPEPTTRLTLRENQIAVLAAQRQTNAEIAAQLFVSPSTVDYHLRKVFQKLNVSSRRQLEKVLPQESH
jgi:DNA-binding CsgD family transcriptional regulator